MYGYKVAESPYKTDNYDSLSWQDAESPYLLGDQSLTDYIYVKATDKAGNERVEMVLPQSAGSPSLAFWIIIILLICLITWILFHQREPLKRK